MKEYLIETVRQQLNIPKGQDAIWTCHAIYSLAGKMALASLWDRDENEDHISPQHFKQRASQIFAAYTAIYPKAADLFPVDQTGIVEDIYAIYVRTGCFYHSPYKISPARFAQSAFEKVILYRGVSPNKKLYMSGLGFYSVRSETADAPSIDTMFGLQTQTFGEYLDELLYDDNWSETEWPQNAEFLQLKATFSDAYWESSPDKDGKISLMRYGYPNKLYAFYQVRDDRVLQKAVPEWRIKDVRFISYNPRDNYMDYSEDGEYRRIAVALLDRYKALPPIKVRLEGPTARIQLGYRLPPTEEDLFKLYSWPIEYRSAKQEALQTFRNIFCRRMSISVYQAFRQHLEMIGYRFEEE